jgi:hypothetical protein
LPTYNNLSPITLTNFSLKIFQEGHKPHCIITANLNVGGSLDQKASNGNTGILINGREITKSELQMLKVWNHIFIYFFLDNGEKSGFIPLLPVLDIC